LTWNPIIKGFLKSYSWSDARSRNEAVRKLTLLHLSKNSGGGEI